MYMTTVSSMAPMDLSETTVLRSRTRRYSSTAKAAKKDTPMEAALIARWVSTWGPQPGVSVVIHAHELPPTNLNVSLAKKKKKDW